MIKYFTKHTKHLIFLTVLIIVEPVLNSNLNLWLARLFDTATTGTAVTAIIRLLLIGFLIWLGKRIVIFSIDVIKKNLMCNIRLNIKNDVFYNVMHKNTSDIFDQGGSGEYTSIFINDINILEDRYYSKIVDLALCATSIIINGAAFFYLNYNIALPIVIFSVAVSFVPAVASKQLNNSNFKYSNGLSKFTQKLKEFFTAYPAIKNYAVEKGILQAFNDINYNTENAKFSAEYELNLANCIGSTLSWFTQIVAIGIGLVMIINGEVLIGTVIAARAFASDIAEPLQGLISNLNSIRSVKKIVTNMDEMTKADESIHNEDEVVVPDDYNLSYNNVSLTINDNHIINNFSFTFNKGKKYLVVGKNGCGKSTLFKLLKKKNTDYTGDIMLGTTDIRNMTSNDMAMCVSYLTESAVFVSENIINNVKFFRQIDDSTLNNALAEARVGLDVTRNLLDGASNISSGEQRRIEIARSMCTKAEIMIFDEVISTLDIKTAYEIESMVLNYDKTVIFVSHNFSGKLIKQYDEILVMDNGKLLDHGNYDTLVNRCEEFREICDIKFGNNKN